MPKRRFGVLRAAHLLTASLLAGCSSQSRREEVVTPPAVAAPASLVAAGLYRIDSTQSEIRLLVYRAGPLAHLGHNHVIINRGLSGTAQVAPAAGVNGVAAASFSLTIPVLAFVVDDAGARSEEGADFSEEVPDDARGGTRHNLLSAEVLDAARFATITLDSVAVAADGNLLTSTIALQVAGHRSTIVVPFMIQKVDDHVEAKGELKLRQSAIGLTPFRALLGALAVQDEFEVKFHVVALPR